MASEYGQRVAGAHEAKDSHAEHQERRRSRQRHLRVRREKGRGIAAEREVQHVHGPEGSGNGGERDHQPPPSWTWSQHQAGGDDHETHRGLGRHAPRMDRSDRPRRLPEQQLIDAEVGTREVLGPDHCGDDSSRSAQSNRDSARSPVVPVREDQRCSHRHEAKRGVRFHGEGSRNDGLQGVDTQPQPKTPAHRPIGRNRSPASVRH